MPPVVEESCVVDETKGPNKKDAQLLGASDSVEKQGIPLGVSDSRCEGQTERVER